MIEQLAQYASIITAAGLVMVVWQMEKAASLLKMINKFLMEAVEHDGKIQ